MLSATQDLIAFVRSRVPGYHQYALAKIVLQAEESAADHTVVKEKFQEESTKKMVNLLGISRTIRLLERLRSAVCKLMLNYSHSMMYILCFCAHASSGSVSSMIYPLVVVGWLPWITGAALVRPRPSAKFWKGIIAYSGLLVCIKFALTVRVWCNADAEYMLALSGSNCPDETNLEKTYWEWTYIIGVFAGNKPGYFLWDAFFDAAICLCANMRTIHLEGVGQSFENPRLFMNTLARKTTTRPDDIAFLAQAGERAIVQIRTIQRWWRKMLLKNKLKTDGWTLKTPKFGSKSFDEVRLYADRHGGSVDSVSKATFSAAYYGTGVDVKKEFENLDKDGNERITREEYEENYPMEDDVEMAFDNHYYAHDYYLPMSTFQMLGFLWMLIFYPTLAPTYVDYYTSGSTDDLVTVFNMSSIEIDYLGCLMTLFTHLVVDRVIYLTRSRTIKIVLQMANILVLHFCMLYTFKLQATIPSNRRFLLAVFYLLECGYLYFSARQICCGYTQTTQRDFLLSRAEHQVPLPVSYSNEELLHSVELKPGPVIYYSYQVFRMIPFLFEMKCILDWWFIETTLDLIEYIKLQDLHGTIFSVAYIRTYEDAFQRYVGYKQVWWYKHLAGGLVFVGLVILIW